MAVTGQDSDDYDDEQARRRRRPGTTALPRSSGRASLGLAVIGILVAAVTYVSRQFSEPPEAPLYYVEPSFSATATSIIDVRPPPQTITSTSPPVTTDINPSTTSPTSSSDTSSSETSTPRTTAADDEDEDEESTPRTTRRGRARM